MERKEERRRMALGKKRERMRKDSWKNSRETTMCWKEGSVGEDLQGGSDVDLFEKLWHLPRIP